MDDLFLILFYKPTITMDPQKLKDIAGRLQKGGKGASASIGLLAVAGGALYGLYKSMYTGNFGSGR